MKYKVVVYASTALGEPEKIYNTDDKSDAKEIFEHWKKEADGGNVIIMTSTEGRTQQYIKHGSGRMTVLRK